MSDKPNRKTSKQLTDASQNLAEKVETELIESGEASIEVRGLTFQEENYARQKSTHMARGPRGPRGEPGEVDEIAQETLLRTWYMRFSIKSVDGKELPREAIDMAVCKLHAIPDADMQELYTYPSIAEALFLGIWQKTHNTQEELEALDFSLLFPILSLPAPDQVAAPSALA